MLFLIPLQDLVVFVSVFHVSLPTQLQSLSFGFGVALFPLPVLNMLTFWDLPWCCNLPSPFSSNSVSADSHFTSKAGLYFSKFCFCFFDDIAKNFSWAQLYICVWKHTVDLPIVILMMSHDIDLYICGTLRLLMCNKSSEEIFSSYVS